MENNLHDIDLIQRYFDRTLSEGEKEEMQRRLSEEPALKAMYSEMELLVSGIRYSHMKDKLEQLRLLESSFSELGDEPKGKSLKFDFAWKPLAVAASIVLVVSCWFVFFKPDSTPLNERLFAKNFEAFDSPGPGIVRSETTDSITWKTRAYIAYDNEQYEESIGYFIEALKQSDEATLHLCIGNAYLKAGKTEDAENIFRHMITDHEDLRTQAKWYLALTYLKQSKMVRVKATLWEISKSPTSYGEDARKLLEELE